MKDDFALFDDLTQSSLHSKGEENIPFPSLSLPSLHILVGYDTYSAFRGQLRRGRANGADTSELEGVI